MEITKENFIQSGPKPCAYCSKIKRSKEDLASIFETGMCMNCDHVYGECLDERLTEMREQIGIYDEENN
jgi:hypothetical protein